MVLVHRKNWIFSRAGTRWRAWKPRLRKNWLYRSIGIIREKPPKAYRGYFKQIGTNSSSIVHPRSSRLVFFVVNI